MMTPPVGGAGVAERVRATADDDPVRELPDAAILSGALCRVGASAMHAAYGKYSQSRCPSPRARWRKPYWRSVLSTSRPYHQARRPMVLKWPLERLAVRTS
jgi:hypothetical protein